MGTFLVHPRVTGRSVLRQERNRSERAKVASVAEWKPPRPDTSFAPPGYPRCRNNGGHEPEVRIIPYE
jgi:hypothetical protein